MLYGSLPCTRAAAERSLSRFLTRCTGNCLLMDARKRKRASTPVVDATLHWWMALGENPNLWGTHPARGTFSWEPIVTVLVALPSAAIFLVTRLLVQAWLPTKSPVAVMRSAMNVTRPTRAGVSPWCRASLYARATIARSIRSAFASTRARLLFAQPSSTPDVRSQRRQDPHIDGPSRSVSVGI